MADTAVTAPVDPGALDDLAVERQAADPPADTPGGLDLGFRPDIEGLRALAVTLVVLYHSGVSWVPGGYVGVDVFFVISGYLITGLLLREHEKRKRISIPGFYARRARRILPAASVVIILAIAAAYHFQNFLTFADYADDGKWAALFSANFHFAALQTNYFDQSLAPSPLLHFWSLAVEEQFYVVWPTVVLVVAALARRHARFGVMIAALVACVVSFAWAVHSTHVDLTYAYYSPLARAWELGLGALAATVVAYAAKVPRWVGFALAWGGIAAILVAAASFGALTLVPGTPTLLPVLGTVAVIIGGASGIGAVHVLGLRPVRAVGRVSYGWYLLHYPPMIILAGPAWFGPLSVHERLEIAAVTLAGAFVMYAVLEKPIRRSRFLARRPWTSIAMGLVFVLGAFLVSALVHKSF